MPVCDWEALWGFTSSQHRRPNGGYELFAEPFALILVPVERVIKIHLCGEEYLRLSHGF